MVSQNDLGRNGGSDALEAVIMTHRHNMLLGKLSLRRYRDGLKIGVE